ncbi:uncharacterized protein LOC114245710 [Bombyx mandarina]|uniref:Uncharacterized protein LOC114245710 n=1 Tax=Bombyx mandarina TaxID=7092 RepID=A0A6J2JWI9_BOMMA|nr:uncharacterized protein LOC114245710 [Bombyx mandarina]
MAFSCSQCDFTAQFESALTMHRQLHHPTEDDVPQLDKPLEKANTLPRAKIQSPITNGNENTNFKLPGRTSSATRLFDRLRAKIYKSRTLFSHPEENDPLKTFNDISIPSECTSKHLRIDSVSRTSAMTTCLRDLHKETYGCHLCSSEFDRITALDRHLLNDHKISLEELLKLVLNKTKDCLNDEDSAILGIKQPYYKPPDEIIEDGEFIIETVTPKIKILKHTSTNTDLQLSDAFVMNDVADDGRDLLLAKMKVLNDCMCKFVDSSNALKKVLVKEIDNKTGRARMSGGEPVFNLSLGDHDSPRDWNRTHSENLQRRENKHGDRIEKTKMSNESFYF